MQIATVLADGYTVKWFRTFNGKTFFQQGSPSYIQIDHECLVHHFDKLTGKLKSKGGVPAKELQVIKQVVSTGKDALCNADNRCKCCNEEFDDDDDDLVECDRCSGLFHEECAGEDSSGGDEDCWFCNNCRRLHGGGQRSN